MQLVQPQLVLQHIFLLIIDLAQSCGENTLVVAVLGWNMRRTLRSKEFELTEDGWMHVK